jgi:hypothetical protein
MCIKLRELVYIRSDVENQSEASVMQIMECYKVANTLTSVYAVENGENITRESFKVQAVEDAFSELLQELERIKAGKQPCQDYLKYLSEYKDKGFKIVDGDRIFNN